MSILAKNRSNVYKHLERRNEGSTEGKTEAQLWITTKVGAIYMDYAL